MTADGRSAFYERRVDGIDTEKAAERLGSALKQTGFGVLGDLSFDRILKEKTGKDIEPVRLLEVCKPPFALKALQANRELAQVMPCRIMVFGEEGGVRLSLYRPTVAMKLVGGEVQDLASEVEAELVSALDAVAEEVE